MHKIRSYSKLVNEIINLNTEFRVEIIGHVSYNNETFPMLALKHTSKQAKNTIVITAGQHGTENYAVNILLQWIKHPITHIDYNYYIFPICNPWGYAFNKRANGAQQDTNNDKSFYKDSKVKELAILYDNFPQTADMIIDLHGDNKESMYAYEHKSDNLPSIVEPALIENDKLIPYVKAKTIYKIPVHSGTITPPPCDIGIEGAIEKLGVTYTITLEFPEKYDGQKRTEGGIAILNSILKNYKGLK